MNDQKTNDGRFSKGKALRIKISSTHYDKTAVLSKALHTTRSSRKAELSPRIDQHQPFL